MITNEQLTEPQKVWLMSIDSSELKKFFKLYRTSRLQSLDAANVPEQTCKDVQAEITAIYRIEYELSIIRGRLGGK